MTSAATAPEYNVFRPDGGLFKNRHDETVFTLGAAEQISTRIGGSIRPVGETPLEGLDEHLIPEGAHWTPEGPQGQLWAVRWDSATGAVKAQGYPRGSGEFHGEAQDLPAARREALRIAALIADGKTREGR
jgi:hypothetical protein